jgi:hypothetical protein
VLQINTLKKSIDFKPVTAPNRYKFAIIINYKKGI